MHGDLTGSQAIRMISSPVLEGQSLCKETMACEENKYRFFYQGLRELTPLHWLLSSVGFSRSIDMCRSLNWKVC